MKWVLVSCFFLFPFLIGRAQTAEELRKKYDTTDLQKEVIHKMITKNDYPDSLVLPPLHFVNTTVVLDTAAIDFQSLSIDITIKDTIPDDFGLYISPFTAALNGMVFYCGMQTLSSGKKYPSGKNDEQIGRGGIFSRWMERDVSALRTTGYYESSDSEGDFIGVRNTFKWNTGRYRILLQKKGIVPGKKVVAGTDPSKLNFSWGSYVHAWVVMTIENLSSHKKAEIGALAFPGEKLSMEPLFGVFIEQYNRVLNFGAKNRTLPFPALYFKEIPKVSIVMNNLTINGKKHVPLDVTNGYNQVHHPDQDKIRMPVPVLADFRYDASTQSLFYTIGKLPSEH